MKNFVAVFALGTGLMFSAGSVTFAASTTGSVVLDQPYELSEYPGCNITFTMDAQNIIKAQLDGNNAASVVGAAVTVSSTLVQYIGSCGGSPTLYAGTTSGYNNGPGDFEFTVEVGRRSSAESSPGANDWYYYIADPKDTFTTDLPPATAAVAPTGLTVTSTSSSADNSLVTVSFTEPGDNGGAEITDYEYQVDGGAWTSSGQSTSPIYINGLSAATEYTVAIRAVNSAGAGASSDTVTFTTADVLSAPSTPDVSVEVGDGSATVTWTVASDGGGTINNVEYQLDGGDWTTAPDATGTIALDGLENGREYSVAVKVSHLAGASEASAAVTFTPGSSGSSDSSDSSDSSGGSVSAAEVATANVIQSDAMRATRSAVTANNSMMLKGLTRFMGDRLSGMTMADAISTSGVSSVVVSPELRVLEDTLFGSGSFAGQAVSADGTYRRVTFGEFDIQHEMGAGTTASFNGRMAWERAAGDDAMIAYFMGAEVNRSDIEGDYSGSQNRYGLTGGVYGFKALENNIFLAGYGSLGAARSSLDISDGAGSDVTGDFTSRTLSVGGQVSGHAEYEGFELRPMLNVNLVKTWVGDITMDESGTSIDVAVGDTTFAELIATPEFLFPLEQHAESKMVTVASVAPRVICERTDAADTISSQCGAGLELGINGTSEDGATSLNAGIRFDRVGGIDRRGLNLQAEFRF